MLFSCAFLCSSFIVLLFVYSRRHDSDDGGEEDLLLLQALAESLDNMKVIVVCLIVVHSFPVHNLCVCRLLILSCWRTPWRRTT